MSVPEHVRLYLDPQYWKVAVRRDGVMWRVTVYRRDAGVCLGLEKIVSFSDFLAVHAINKCFHFMEDNGYNHCFGSNFDLERTYKHPQYPAKD